MSIKDYGKLARLKIISVNNPQDYFEVMFNPESYSETFAVAFEKQPRVNGGLEEFQYSKTPPQEFKLKIIIDGTGVSDYESSVLPVFKLSSGSVYDQVNSFLKLAWYPVSGKAVPLQIVWGSLSFHCLLKDVTINYTLFDRDGIPLRAELDADFMSDPDQYEADCEKRFNPDKPPSEAGGITTTTTTTTVTKTTNDETQTTTTSVTTKRTKTTNNGIVISVS